MQTPRVQLRKATVLDVQTLRFWDTQPHVIDSDPNDDWDWDVELAKEHSWREQLMAESDGVPIGFIQIIDPAQEETNYWQIKNPGFRAIDIWIGLEEHLGKGFGTLMMRQAIERCFSNPEVHTILIDPLTSNRRAIRFYERLGFVFQEFRRFGTDECSVYALRRAQVDS